MVIGSCGIPFGIHKRSKAHFRAIRWQGKILTKEMGTLSIYREIKRRYNENRKSSFEAELIFCRYVYRPLSYFPAALCIRAGFTANQISFFNFFVIVGAAVSFLRGDWRGSVVGLLLIWIYAILDFADGNVARYNKATTYFGKLLDGCVDTFSLVIFIPIAIGGLSLGPGPGPDLKFLYIAVAATTAGIFNGYVGQRIAYFSASSADEGEALKKKVEPMSLAKRGLSVGNNIYENMVTSMPVMLIPAVTLQKENWFLLFFFLTHVVLGLGSTVARLIMKKRELTRSRDY